MFINGPGGMFMFILAKTNICPSGAPHTKTDEKGESDKQLTKVTYALEASARKTGV